MTSPAAGSAEDALYRMEAAVRDLLGVLGYDPDGSEDLVIAACGQAMRDFMEWRRDWTRPPLMWRGLAQRGWPSSAVDGSTELPVKFVPVGTYDPRHRAFDAQPAAPKPAPRRGGPK